MTKQAKIVVAGRGTTEGTADRCHLYAGLNVLADTPADAVAKVSAVASRVLDALRSEGVGSGDVRTTQLSV